MFEKVSVLGYTDRAATLSLLLIKDGKCETSTTGFQLTKRNKGVQFRNASHSRQINRERQMMQEQR